MINSILQNGHFYFFLGRKGFSQNGGPSTFLIVEVFVILFSAHHSEHMFGKKMKNIFQRFTEND